MVVVVGGAGGALCKRKVFYSTSDPAQASRSSDDPERSDFFCSVFDAHAAACSLIGGVSVSRLSFYPQPCDNGGRCVLNNASSYTCVCAPGWSGPNCRLDVNDCVQHWCRNGATCVDEIDGYR